jgi:hypothetical protein
LDVHEAQKVERFRFAFPSSFPVLFATELNPARLVGMEFQPKTFYSDRLSDCPPFFNASADAKTEVKGRRARTHGSRGLEAVLVQGQGNADTANDARKARIAAESVESGIHPDEDHSK